ncbi:MAG: translation initiation factor IF-2 [Planctomycetota bacterium]
MALRIYALAKELKIDSKELVDICTQIGIRGKGSALASLSDEEAAKLKEHLQGGGGVATEAPPSKQQAPAPVRPKEPSRSGKMKVLPTTASTDALTNLRKSRAKDEPETQPAEEAPAGTPSDEAAEQTGSESAAASEAAEAPATEAAEASDASKTLQHADPSEATPRGQGPLAGVMRRDDYVGPGRVGGKPPALGDQKGGKGGKGGAAGAGRGRPAIKLAPIPSGEAPPPPPKPTGADPPAQKPDMKLPADALKAGKSGSKPLAAHLRKHEDALEDAKKQKEDEGGRRGRKGKDKGGKSEETPMLGGREQRQLNRKRTPGRSGGRMPFRQSRRPRRKGVSTAAPRKDRITVQLPCTVRELSEAAGVPATDILRILMSEGVMTTITAAMDPEMTEFVAAELGVDVEFKQPETIEDRLLTQLEELEDPEDQLADRPPVITFLGHVDHGKTSLLDSIIGINVVSGESGGITQHIRAYTIDKDNKQISFVDTPGHEAFTEMRARGANVTDIAVLVVAADDGVMPQTEEAISHAQAAEVPIVVALNKSDLPGVDPMKALQQLSQNGLQPSEWGGDIEVVKTSAITGDGIDDLLDTVLTVAELHEYKANPERSAIGTCLEAQQEADRGVVSKLIVQKGTLKVGDVVVCGDAFGRVKAMYDTLKPSVRLEEAGPSTPVNVTGFDSAPGAGERFYVLDDIADAREIAESRADDARAASLGGVVSHVTLENLFDRLDGADEVQTLNIILRADVRGSIEAIEKELLKLEHPEVKIKLLQATVGGVTEADVTLADASDAIIIGFNVVPDEKARVLAEQKGVQVRRYEVIYKITEDLKAALEGMLKPEEREVDLGRALVQQVFKISRVGTVAGCRVLSGTVERNARARVIRDSTIIGDYVLDTLRREKDDAKEVREGFECGMKLSGFNDVKEGDIFEVYRVDEVGRSFDD